MQSHYIREWRRHRGLTQAKLADAMGISRSYLTMIERGDRRYDQPFLESAAEVLQCTPPDLIGRKPGQRESIDAMLASVSEDERARIEAAIRALIAPHNP